MYCTAHDLISRFGEDELIRLTDSQYHAIDMPKVTQAIDDACATIDGYLGGRYSLPLASVPRILVRMASDMARYYLFDDNLDEHHQAAKRYRDAIAYLKEVGKGAVQLGLDDNQAPTLSNNESVVMSAGTVFGRDNSKGFI
uniref:gp436 family protein n=1 Tax=Thaumasiovibrio occultus TaxID=1891184 RepID=UPI000B363783|nr:phage protein Gp36 family protein [Thaumasiovibrio occultus]